MRFRVGSHSVPVEWMNDPRDVKVNMGTYERHEGIRINKQYRPDQQAVTLVHELIHAIWEENELPDAVTEEQAAEFLGRYVTELFMDNLHLRPILEAAFHGNVPLPLEAGA